MTVFIRIDKHLICFGVLHTTFRQRGGCSRCSAFWKAFKCTIWGLQPCLMRQETLIRNGSYFTIRERDFLQLNDITIVGTAVNVMTKKKLQPFCRIFWKSWIFLEKQKYQYVCSDRREPLFIATSEVGLMDMALSSLLLEKSFVPSLLESRPRPPNPLPNWSLCAKR